jgi:hypothetical protein
MVLKIVKMFILLVGMWLVSACQANSVDSGNGAAATHHKGYIAEVQGNRILVGDIYFSIQEAKLVTDKEKVLKQSDLQVGMNVQIEFDGIVAESFPMQASADKVIVMTHSDTSKP